MKLASAEKITAINPIEGADQIEVATVLGWQIVIKKNEFKVGDLVGYIQTDTIVPETPEFEFLRARDFRVRTIKLRKQISQGLIVPLPGKYNEGDDLTDVLGIKKFSKDKEVIEDKPKMPKSGYKKYYGY
jgi:RNA ligase (TIGR02306 family)